MKPGKNKQINSDHDEQEPVLSESQNTSPAQVEPDQFDVLIDLLESNIRQKDSQSQNLEYYEADDCCMDGGASEAGGAIEYEFQNNRDGSSKDNQDFLDLQEKDLMMACLSDDEQQKLDTQPIKNLGTKHVHYKSVDSVFDKKSAKSIIESKLKTTDSQESDDLRSSIVEDHRTQWQHKFPWDDEVDIANQEIFGNENFRENQREIINATKSGKDVLALIPTGGGKSLTFQLSAVTGKGVTFVVMPLLSLIEDNLNFVLDLSIPAVSLSVGNTQKEDKKIGALYAEIRQIQHKIVYLTPEKLVKSPALMNVLDDLYQCNKIDRFVIDEVHCVSHWGQDFRKDYLHLDILKKRFPKVPILGLTATATQKVKDDMAKRLGIKSTVQYFQSSFNRPNLIYEIRTKKHFKSIDSDLVNLLQTRFKKKSGIIYCVSRKDCEQLTETLKRNHKIACDYYHAELPYRQRQEIQSAWMKDQIQVIIATIAFGMGINKKDVRFVIHYSMPKSLEGYVQECGRSGRDQLPAECILYYDYNDRKRSDFFIVSNSATTKIRKKENLRALYSILEYCEEPYLCRRKMQLEFLGEPFDSTSCKGMCDNCRTGLQVTNKDFTTESIQIAKLVEQIIQNKSNFTLKMIVEFLKGRQVKSVYGISQALIDTWSGQLKNYADIDLHRLVIKLLILGVLEEQFVTTKAYGSQKNVSVYVGKGKKIGNLFNNSISVYLTQGVQSSSIITDEQHVQPVHSRVQNLLSGSTQQQKGQGMLKFQAAESQLKDSDLEFVNGGGAQKKQQELNQKKKIVINDQRKYAKLVQQPQMIEPRQADKLTQMSLPQASIAQQEWRMPNQINEYQQNQRLKEQQSWKDPPAQPQISLKFTTQITDFLKEELRQRLHIIRQSITRQNNQDYSDVQTQFNERTFTSLLEVLDVVMKLPEASIDTVLLEALKTNKNQQEIIIIEKFAFLFIAETRHFLNIHDILKPKVQNQLVSQPVPQLTAIKQQSKQLVQFQGNSNKPAGLQMQKRRFVKKPQEQPAENYGFGYNNLNNIEVESDSGLREEEPSIENLTEQNAIIKNRKPFEGVLNINASKKKRKLNFM